MTRNRLMLAALVLVVAGQRTDAQRSALTMALGFQHTSMDSVIAVDRGIGTSGPGFTLSVDVDFKTWIVTSMELGAVFFKDNRPFSQSVVCIPNCGGGSEKSSINTTLFGASIGLQTPKYRMGRVRIGPSVRLGAMTVSGNRAVNCSGCTKQDLALDGGAYVDYRLTSRIGKSADAGVAISVARRQFLSSDSPFSPATVVQLGAMIGK